MKLGTMWECECGNIEYGEFPPQECNKCWQANGFLEIPEDLMEEAKERVLKTIKSSEEELDEEFDGIQEEIKPTMKKPRTPKASKAKSGRKTTSKQGRRKE